MRQLPLGIIELVLSKQISLDARKLALIKSIAHNPNDSERKEQLMKLIYPELIKNKLFGDPFIPYPEQEDFQGEIVLARLPNNCVFMMPIDSFITHVLFSGATGAGKTNSAYSIAVQLVKLNKKFISIGLKRDMRHLSKYLPLLVLKCSEDSNFQWDILNAPNGVSQIDWDTTFIRVFAESEFLREGAESLLLESLNQLRKQHDQVNILDLFNFIKSMKIMTFRGTNWKESCLNRLQALIINFRKMLNTHNSLPLERLSERYNIEFELDKAGEFKSFFSSLIPIYLFKHRIANNLRGNHLKNVIFCDEVNFLASRSMLQSSSFGDTTLLQSIRVGREFGLGFVFFTNEPSAAADTIKAQSAMKILMRQSHWPDIEDMGKSMNLTKEQMECAANLPPGCGIVKIPGLQPFPVTFPLIDIIKDVTDENIETNNYNLLANSEFNEIITPSNDSRIEIQASSEQRTADTEVTSEEKAFLMDIYNRPFISITERYKSMTLSAGKGTRLVKSILRKGLCKIIEINLGGKGGNTKLLVLTEKAFEVLEMPAKHFHCKGGSYEHYFWQYTLAEHLKTMNKEWKVHIEHQAMNKFIDIVIETEEKLIGIEVALTSVNEAINIQKDLEAGCDLVIIACKDTKVVNEVEQIKSNLEQDAKEKVGICLLNKLLRSDSLNGVINSDLLRSLENLSERR